MKYQPEYDPSDDPGNPYQHLLDEDIRLGLSVYGMTKGLSRPKNRED